MKCAIIRIYKNADGKNKSGERWERESKKMAWDKYLRGLGEIITRDPQPAGWIRTHGVQGEYNGRGRVIRIPYQSLVILAGFENMTAKFDQSYAYRENLKLINRISDACPWKGAIVVTDVPDENGLGKYVFTLTEPVEE